MKKIRMVLLTFCFMVLLGCESKTSATGTYRLILLEDSQSGLSITEDDLNNLGMDYIMELSEGGTGYLDMGGQVMELTWNDSEITILDGYGQKYEISGNELKLEDEGAVLLFSKED